MKKSILTVSSLLIAGLIFSQGGVGINNAGVNPAPSAMLDVLSSDKGLLIPRVALTATNAATPVTLPAISLLVYNTASVADVIPGFYYWDGTQWVKIVSGAIVGTDDQDLTGATLTGSSLQIDIENGASTTVDLSALLELPGTATANQVLTWDGTNWIAQTPAAGADNWGTDIVNTSGTNISGDGTTGNPITITEVDGDPNNEIQDLAINTTTNILTITNNGTPTSIDLNPYLDNTDNQNIQGSSFNATTGDLVIGIENGTNQTLNLNGLKDHDWYEVGTATAPDAITDNIFTQGNVGIGVATPTQKLHVFNGNAEFERTSTAGILGTLFLTGTNPSAAEPNKSRWAIFNMNEYSGTYKGLSFWEYYDANGDGSFCNDGVGNCEERMVIARGGNVGIGTAAPIQSLEVSGVGTRVMHVVSTGNTATDRAVIGVKRVGKLWDFGVNTELLNDNNLNIREDGTPRITIVPGGNVGIGTATPLRSLEVQAATGSIRISSTSSGAWAGFEGSLPSGIGYLGFTEVSTVVPGSFFIDESTNGIDFLIEKGTGNIGIGTNTPTNTLEVAGDGTVFLNDPLGGLRYQNNQTVYISPKSGSSAQGAIISVTGVGAGYIRLNPEGGSLSRHLNATPTGVGIGVATPAYQLQLGTNGAAKPGSNTWTVASDRRLKENVSPYTSGLSSILKIEPVWYTYTGEADMPKETFVGVIAQDLKEVAPYMVGNWTYTDKDGKETDYLDVDNGAMTYMLINAIKEQQQIILTLKKEMSKLATELSLMK